MLHPLVLAQATAAAVFAMDSSSLVLAKGAAAAVFAPAPSPVVLAVGEGEEDGAHIQGHLRGRCGCWRIEHQRCALGRALNNPLLLAAFVASRLHAI